MGFNRFAQLGKNSAVALLFSAVATVAIVALSVSGCASPTKSSDDSRLKIVATTTQIGDFARAVGGDAVAVRTLLPAGAGAHHFEPTQADMIALADADVLLTNGLGLDDIPNDAIETSGFHGKKVVTTAGVVPDGSNPHVWTAPVLAGQMVENIEVALSKADPKNAAIFKENAIGYQAKLQILDQWVSANIASVPSDERMFVSGHDALKYYLEAYDIEFVGSVLHSFEDNAKPSVAETDELIAHMKELGVKAIFVESSINPKTAEAIANDTGAKLINESVLYVDSLGAEGSEASTYITATIHNTKTILEAWGYPVTAVPKELK